MIINISLVTGSTLYHRGSTLVVIDQSVASVVEGAAYREGDAEGARRGKAVQVDIRLTLG